MKEKKLTEKIEIPSGIEVSLDNFILKVKGPKGEIIKDIKTSKVKFKKENNKINFTVNGVSRKHKSLLNTYLAHFRNMTNGVTNPYVYKLKVCSGHFPMNVTVD